MIDIESIKLAAVAACKNVVENADKIIPKEYMGTTSGFSSQTFKFTFKLEGKNDEYSITVRRPEII